MSFVSNEAFKFADRKHMEPMSLMGLFQFRSCRSFVRVDFLDLSQDLFWRQLLTQSLYQFLHRNSYTGMFWAGFFGGMVTHATCHCSDDTHHNGGAPPAAAKWHAEECARPPTATQSLWRLVRGYSCVRQCLIS
jgi:hypothetical protein